jgi:hypothetical protein
LVTHTYNLPATDANEAQDAPREDTRLPVAGNRLSGYRF